MITRGRILRNTDQFLLPFLSFLSGVSFAVLTAAISTVALWHWKDVRSALIDRDTAHDDIHVQSEYALSLFRNELFLKILRLS